MILPMNHQEKESKKQLRQNKHHKSAILIALAFCLAVVLNTGLNLWLLYEEGHMGSAQFDPNKMTTASDKLIQLNQIVKGNSDNVPILVFGSSHAHRGFNPEKSTLPYPVFNAAMKGTFFKSQLFLLKLLLKENKKPPLLIVEVSPILTNTNLAEYFIRRPILPYLLASHPDYLYSELKNDPNSWVMFFQMIQKFHPVRSMLGEKKHDDYFTPLGFEPRRELNSEEKNDTERFKRLTWNYAYDYHFDYKEAEKLIQKLQEENIPAVFVAYPMTPSLRDHLTELGVLQKFQTALKTLKEKHHIDFIDATDWYNNNEHFYDGNHLTGSGANYFTQDLTPVLLPMVKQAIPEEGKH